VKESGKEAFKWNIKGHVGDQSVFCHLFRAHAAKMVFDYLLALLMPDVNLGVPAAASLAIHPAAS